MMVVREVRDTQTTIPQQPDNLVQVDMAVFALSVIPSHPKESAQDLIHLLECFLV
jgi:hypothetical protein